MPVMMIGPAEFAALLEEFAKELLKDLPVPSDPDTAIRAAVRIMAGTSILEKAGTFRHLARQMEMLAQPVQERLVPFPHRLPRGAWLS